MLSSHRGCVACTQATSSFHTTGLHSRNSNHPFLAPARQAEKCFAESLSLCPDYPDAIKWREKLADVKVSERLSTAPRHDRSCRTIFDSPGHPCVLLAQTQYNSGALETQECFVFDRTCRRRIVSFCRRLKLSCVKNRNSFNLV